MSLKSEEAAVKPGQAAVFDQAVLAGQKELSSVFERALLEMRKSINTGVERRVLENLRSAMEAFGNYLKKREILLGSRERQEYIAILRGPYTIQTRKKLFDDFTCKIKTRVFDEKKAAYEKTQAQDEVNELLNQKGKLSAWLGLCKFSFLYHTISFFTHEFRKTALQKIKNRHVDLQYFVKTLKPILDREFNSLTNLEYNAFALFLELNSVYEMIRDIEEHEQFHRGELDGPMNEFTGIYLKILKNRSYLKEQYDKIFKKRVKVHGLYGAFRSVIDEPLYNNINYYSDEKTFLTESVTGALISYFSAREGVLVHTLNQLLFVCKTDGVIDAVAKNLTPQAMLEDQKLLEKLTAEENIKISRLRELHHTVEHLYLRGHDLAETSLAFFAVSQPALKIKPLLYFRCLIELFEKCFAASVCGDDRESFSLLYQNAEFRNFFSDKKSLQNCLSRYSLDEFGLRESARDLIHTTTPVGEDTKNFIFRLFTAPRNNHAMTYDDRIKEIIAHIGNVHYEIACVLEEFIKSMENGPGDAELTARPDFYNHARVHGENFFLGNSFRLINKSEPTLRDFLESALALAVFIAKETFNSGMHAVFSEYEKLKDDIKVIIREKTRDADDTADDREKKTSPADIPDFYYDIIMQIPGMDYWSCEIIPRITKDGLYQAYETRFVFFCDPDNLQDINARFGHTAGDKALYTIAKIVEKNICREITHGENIVFRCEGCNLAGYINSVTLEQAVMTLHKTAKELSKMIIFFEGNKLPGLTMSIGIYEERRGSKAEENLALARLTAAWIKKQGKNNIGYPADKNRVLKLTDFNSEKIQDIIETLH
ncbi:MAG: hypothetical protein A2096_03705 [Spirochaetes bacterium GWF1_41_5]|nr:MAG: hypothetical protein A2096_03705 [Spirochaetes bacterium GWF1_41_5]HBE03895.1 hypothetical protein [Spirochaetia bacterium]